MKDGICPKCGATTVHYKRQDSRWFRPSLTTFEAISLNRYLGTSCGYAENYGADRHQRTRIAKNWPRATE